MTKPKHPNTAEKLEQAVAYFADGKNWAWNTVISSRDAADSALNILAEFRLIEKREHPSGGTIWKLGRKLYGRTDGMTIRKFNKLKY